MHVAMSVVLRIAIQQALFSLAKAAFRRPPLNEYSIVPPSNSLNFSASQSQSEDLRKYEWSHTCVRNTGRMCEASTNPGQDVVDYMGQCDELGNEHCSTGQNFPAGHCICTPGWCANGHGTCVKERGVLVDQVFYIHTQQFGTSHLLYMTPDGRVILGDPVSNAQAQWRIVVNPDGIMKLFTNAYPSRLLDSYEHCVQFTETVKCQTMLGGMWKPAARDTGWAIDHSGDYAGDHQGSFAEAGEYVWLRDFESSKNMYIHHLTHEARLCSPSDYNCPGTFGNLVFTPSIHGHVEIPLTYPPPTTTQQVFHYIGIILIIIIALFLCIMNARLDNKLTHLDDNVLTRPANCLKAIVTCELCSYGGTRRR